jgi:hypothetical protein
MANTSCAVMAVIGRLPSDALMKASSQRSFLS